MKTTKTRTRMRMSLMQAMTKLKKMVKKMMMTIADQRKKRTKQNQIHRSKNVHSALKLGLRIRWIR